MIAPNAEPDLIASLRALLSAGQYREVATGWLAAPEAEVVVGLGRPATVAKPLVGEQRHPIKAEGHRWIAAQVRHGSEVVRRVCLEQRIVELPRE